MVVQSQLTTYDRIKWIAMVETRHDHGAHFRRVPEIIWQTVFQLAPKRLRIHAATDALASFENEHPGWSFALLQPVFCVLCEKALQLSCGGQARYTRTNNNHCLLFAEFLGLGGDAWVVWYIHATKIYVATSC
jgi:hypothetical protein